MRHLHGRRARRHHLRRRRALRAGGGSRAALALLVPLVVANVGTVFAAYLLAGVLAHPDWGAAARGLVVPSVPGTRDGLLAGSFASALFGAGLLGAALLAASVVPLSTAYSVAEAAGHPRRLDDGWRQAPLFYATYIAVTGVTFAAIAASVIALAWLSL